MQPQRNLELSSSKSDRKKVRDRKKNINKKAEELSTLCGVDVGLIFYQRQSTVAETWPEDPAEVGRIISKYKAKRGAETKGLHGGHENVNNSDEEREILYPTWDDRLDCFSEDELSRLVASLDAKLEASTYRNIDSLSKKTCNGFGTPKKKTSNTIALDHHHMTDLNLKVVPFREINGPDRSSKII